MNKYIRKTLVSCLVFLTIFGSSVSPVFADKNNKTSDGWTKKNDVQDSVDGGGLAEAGEVVFDTESILYDNHSIDPNEKILACNSNCTSYYETTMGEFIKDALVDKDQYEDIITSEQVWLLTDKNQSKKLGKPVFYSKDSTEKRVSDWYTKNTKGNSSLNKVYEYVDKETKGALSKGDYPSTILYSNILPGKPKPPQPPVTPPSMEQHPDHIYCQVGSGPKYKKTHTENAGSQKIEGVQAVFVRLTPVKPVGFSSLSAEQQAYWNKTHQPQMVGPELTPFGAYLQNNSSLLASLKPVGNTGGLGANSTYRQRWESFASGAQAAINQGVQELSLQMSPLNQEGFGRGGLFTFTELRKYVSITTHHKQDKYDEYGCVNQKYYQPYYDTIVKWEFWNGEWHQKHEQVLVDHWVTKTTYKYIGGNRIIDGQYTEDEVVVVTSLDYRPYLSYQELNVRCNKSAFDQLINAVGGTVQSTGSGKGSSTAKSPTTNLGVATFYNSVDVDFFYKGTDCDDVFGCSSAPNPSANHDAKNNVQDTGHNNGTFGAQSDGKSSSKFTFFRDNVSREIRNDVWYLAPNNMTPEFKHDSNAPATATFLALAKYGTPKDNLFALEDRSGNVIIDGYDINGSPYGMFNNQQNRFLWRASWASEKDKPHALSIQYAYRPNVVNANLSSLSRSNVGLVNTEYVLDMYCDVKFNTTQPGVPQIKNQPKQETYYPKDIFTNDPTYHYTVDFVKSSAE